MHDSNDNDNDDVDNVIKAYSMFEHFNICRFFYFPIENIFLKIQRNSENNNELQSA